MSQNPSPSQQVTAHVKDAKYERWRIQIFAITWLAYVGFYLTRKAYWVAKVGMGENSAVGLTLDQMGWIELGYGTCYAVGQFIFGMSGDLFGPRKVVLAGLFLSACTCFAMGLSSTAILLGFLFGLQGLWQSTGWAPLSKNVNNFFSRRERGRMMGIWCTNYAAGGFIASAFAGWFGLQFGFRYALFAPAVTLLGFFGIFYLFQRNRPEDVGLESIEQYHGEEEAILTEDEMAQEECEGSWKNIKDVLANKIVMLLALTYFFLKPTRYAIFAWGPKYMNESLGTNILQSGILASLFELAGPISVFLGGLISDRFFNTRRVPISAICLLLVTVLLFVFPYLPATKLAMGTGLFFIGFFLYAPDSLVVGTAAIDFGTKKGASTAAGVINGCGSFGALIGLSLPGFVAARWGWPAVFWMLGSSTLIAGLLLAPQWNALPKTKKQP